MPKARVQSQKFEESLSSLEKIVMQLEAGDLPLESALEIFEEGVGLARRCQAQLADAERRVELLLREHGELKTIPFGEFPGNSPAKREMMAFSRSAGEEKAEDSASADLPEEAPDEDDGDTPNDNVPF